MTSLAEWNTETDTLRQVASHVPSAGLVRVADSDSIIFPMMTALYQWDPSI